MSCTITGLFRAGAVGAAVLALAACGGGGGGTSSTASGMGTLRVALTDAPACGFDSVNVTVDRVRVNQSADAADTDAGWSDIALSQPTKIDLLSLSNGVLFSLGQTALPAGQYQQVRLVLAANSGSGSPANSVTPTGGAETALQTPSAMQSGIKLISPFTVQPGTLVDLVLDFDACKSIVTLGNGRFLLKPVISVTPLQVSGTITGQLTTTISGTAVTQASVSAQKDGTVIRATVPSASGAYTLAPIDARSQPYDLVVTMSGAATSVVSSVPVTAGNTTNVPPISLTPTMSSSMGAVSGSVSPATALPATVRALQQVGSVPQVEVASTNTDGAGAYSLSAPKAAAWLAPYSASTLSFSASGTANYTIEAKDAAGSTQTLPADISA
ncbi:MAG: DUF4382 domain-containing protein, partial [Gemmatimonadota bacterium]